MLVFSDSLLFKLDNMELLDCVFIARTDDYGVLTIKSHLAKKKKSQKEKIIMV